MTFAPEWLDLREPADREARDPGLLAAAAAHLAAVPDPVALDLGCGTGATARALRVPGLSWRLVDNDPRLLALAGARTAGAVTILADLSDLDAVPVEGARLVTASALLDLVSAGWLDTLARRIVSAGAGFYATLNVDGTVTWGDRRADDDRILAAFEADQRRDKGLGRALGSSACAAAARSFADLGYTVTLARSPWRLTSAEAALQAALVDGIAAVAAQGGVPGTANWAQARRAANGCTVGHVDLLAVPLPSTQSKTTSESRP